MPSVSLVAEYRVTKRLGDKPGGAFIAGLDAESIAPIR
jgi:hypothetical protein